MPHTLFASTFLSTPSARRATAEKHGADNYVINFYPRPPRGGRRGLWDISWSTDIFLSTPSARRATSLYQFNLRRRTYFYPRPPRGGRRELVADALKLEHISIHALREEGDSSPTCWPMQAANFYPRPPRGGRRDQLRKIVAFIEFLSTPSARRATWISI